MKVLHINCASTGSTGKIIEDIADHAATAGIETLLCTPASPGKNKNIRYFKTSLPCEQGLYRRLNRLYGFQYGLAPLSTIRIKTIIKREKPDLIHIHCVNGFMVNVYSLMRYLKRKRIPIVLTNHAEFFYTGNCAHAYECRKWLAGCGKCPQRMLATGTKLRDTSAVGWGRMRRAFSSLEKAIMVSVSPWVESRAKQSPITGALNHRIVLNGVNTSIFAWRDSESLRSKYGFSSQTKIVFHPTANFSASEQDSKGGRFVMELAERFADQDVLFVVAGKHTHNMKTPKNLILLGQISDQTKLAEYYAMADVTVITGKRETFGMPVAESLCCGTPVVGFQAGGPESIAIKEYTAFVEYANVDELKRILSENLEKNYETQLIASRAKEKYAAEVMSEGYIDIYRELLVWE